jgi:anti-sigma factor ChrR (cupin superfamily)
MSFYRKEDDPGQCDMSLRSNTGPCEQAGLMSAYALGALPSAEVPLAEAHLACCPRCRQAAEALKRVVDSFAAWPTDVLRPAAALWDRLVDRIGQAEHHASRSTMRRWSEPRWEDVAPGISCKLLSSDSEGDRVAMLVRLAPGASYPPHTHASGEELHLLSGELWIDAKRLHPGDYNRAEPDTSDRRVWSQTGCTCLLISSPSDVLG